MKMLQGIRNYSQECRSYIQRQPKRREVERVLRSELWKTRDRIFEEINEYRASKECLLMDYQGKPFILPTSHRDRVLAILDDLLVRREVELRYANDFPEEDLSFAGISNEHEKKEEVFEVGEGCFRGRPFYKFRIERGGPGDTEDENKDSEILASPILV